MTFDNPANARRVLREYVGCLETEGISGDTWMLYLLNEVALICEEKKNFETANLLFDVIDTHEATVSNREGERKDTS